MKLSITYLYTISKYGYPPAIEIEKMGFGYLEMEGLGDRRARH